MEEKGIKFESTVNIITCSNEELFQRIINMGKEYESQLRWHWKEISAELEENLTWGKKELEERLNRR